MNNYKTLAELAQEFGVSKNTIANHLKALGIYDNLQEVGGNGRKLVSPDQAKMVKQSIFSDLSGLSDNLRDLSDEMSDLGSTETEEKDDLIDGYTLLLEKHRGLETLYGQAQQMNSILQKELEIKNKQIEDLSTALVAAQQTAQAAQALHAGTIQQLGQGAQNEDQADHQGQTEDRPSSTQNNNIRETPKSFWAKLRRR